jgi:hypothetical protein
MSNLETIAQMLLTHDTIVIPNEHEAQSGQHGGRIEESFAFQHLGRIDIE